MSLPPLSGHKMTLIGPRVVYSLLTRATFYMKEGQCESLRIHLFMIVSL